jgi:hypothetical protein
MSSVVAISLFILLAMPISLVLRPFADSFFLAPLIAFCLGIVSTTVALVFQLSLGFTYVLVAFIITIISFTNAKIRKSARKNLKTLPDLFDLMFLSILLVFGIAFLIYLPPPLAWDARSIWLFHASWLSHGGSVFSDAQTLESLSFSHPSYPLGGPAAIAIVWLFSGIQENLWLGVTVVALLALTNTIFSIKLLLAPYAQKAHTLGLAVLAATLCCVVFLDVSGNALSGYMDVLLATTLAVVVAALLGLLTQHQRKIGSGSKELIAIASLGFFAAVGLKQEGIFFSLVLIVAFGFVQAQNRIQIAVLIGSAFTSYFFWKVAIATSGGISESDASGILSNFPELFDLDSVAWSNFSIIWNGYFRDYLLYPNFMFLISVLALLMEPKSRRSLRILTFASIAWVGYWAVVFAPYMLGQSRVNLGWWLDTSFNRVVTTQLVFTFVFCGFVLARAATVTITGEKFNPNSTTY